MPPQHGCRSANAAIFRDVLMPLILASDPQIPFRSGRGDRTAAQIGQ